MAPPDDEDEDELEEEEEEDEEDEDGTKPAIKDDGEDELDYPLWEPEDTDTT